MNSNLKNPLAFFEYILDEQNLSIEINKRLIYSGFNSYAIILPHKIKYTHEDNYGEIVEGIAGLKEEVIYFLRIEFEKSKNLLKEKYQQNNLDFNGSFLNLLFNTLQSLINNKSEFLNKYPYFLLPLRGLVKFINDTLLLPNMQQFTLNEDQIDINPVNEDFNILKSNEDIIHSVISYMGCKNEKQKLILREKDFLLLKEYVMLLVTEEKVPTITIKLQPDLSNDLIRFTFWVLHKELYTTKIIRQYFYDFIKAVFIKFKDNEISSIKSQFGTRSRVSHDDFIPEIILKYLK